ncbi:hypothetical protein Tco_0900104, partial [Tanacetum coccineum]
VNADGTADKSLSRASMQPVTRLKAPTDLKANKKKNTPSSKPKSLYKARVIHAKKQVANTQHAEVTVATADATQSLEASELAEEQDVTFEQIIDEFDSKTQGAQENVESPYDTESEIKIIKSYQAATISDTEEGDASESFSGLRSMLDDDLASMTGFETQDSANHVSKEGTETLHASADKPAQSDPLGHLHEELCLLHNKVNQLESSITKHVSDSIQAIVPVIVTNTLKEQLPGLLSDALKDTRTSSKVLFRNLLQRKFNAFNKLESHIFVLLQKELSKSLHNKMRKSIRQKVQKGMKEVRNKLSFYTSTMDSNSQHVQDLRIMFKDMVSLLEAAEGEQPSAQVVPIARQAPRVNKEKALVIHTSEEKSLEEDTSGKKESDNEPPVKKLKFLIPSSLIPLPTPLNKSTSSIFSPTPPREPTPPKEPTPPRDSAKGKEVTITEEQVNKFVSYQEEGGSNPKMPKIKSFTTLVRPLSEEEFNAQIKEIKRLADLKVEKEKSEQELRKMFNQATLKAQAQKWTEHEAKNVKMMEEYNHLISFRADKLPITKISYVVNPNKEATMKITRGESHCPSNFRLKTMGFSEWLEVHALASKKSRKSNDMFLQSLRAKFQWVINQEKKLGLHPPPTLATFGMTAEDKKRKRTEILE